MAEGQKMTKKFKSNVINRKTRNYYTVQRWKCIHQKDISMITAYVEGSDWETIAEVKTTSGASAEMMAEYICSVINENQAQRMLLLHAQTALQTCLEEDELSFASEQSAERVMSLIKKMVT
jgi:hypothetical protein